MTPLPLHSLLKNTIVCVARTILLLLYTPNLICQYNFIAVNFRIFIQFDGCLLDFFYFYAAIDVFYASFVTMELCIII